MSKPIEIVFVDDEPFILSALKRTVSRLLPDYTLRFIGASLEALDFVKRHKPAVIVSDLRMPDMDGLTLITAIHDHVPETRAIMLTGTADLQSTIQAINAAGVFRFYTKPFDAVLLSEGIEEAVTAWRRTTNNSLNGTPSLTERIGAAALNHLRLAVIVLDDKARVLYTNSAGAELFSIKDGLLWGREEICKAAVPEQTRQLHQLISAAASNDRNRLGDGIMSITRQDMKRALSVAIAPLEDNKGATGGYAAMFVSDPDRASVPKPEAIATWFGLTPSEARLAHALVLGERLEQAADTTGVTLSTARTYLKHIFQKTHTNRQSELIRLVLSGNVTF